MTTPTTVQVRLQIRADTAANWASVNPVLLANELGLESDTKKFKVGNGSSAWGSLTYFPSVVSGGTVLGNLEIGTTGTLTFEGSTADGFETTLGVVDPTADRTITLPDASGTVFLTSGGTLAGDLTLNNQSDLRFADADSSNWVAFQAPTTVSSNVTWTLPATDAASAGDALVSDAAGTLSWASSGGSVTSVDIAGGTGLTSSGGPITSSGTITVDLDNTAVTPGSYTYASITVDQQGRLTAASNGTTPLTSSDIGSTVQGYDADTAKLDVVQTFTAVQTLTDPAIIGTILEDVYTITDGAAFEVDPGNGSVQLITLGANRTPKATNFAAGESVTLMVDDGTAYTITWTDTTWGTSGVVWTGGSAPTLATTGYTVIQLWKVGTQVYGAYVGDAA